ncbi:MAG TPA: response regulator [Blastocatellia bacterium]|nr:response regulator [Blastocatellia bacterium]
MLFGVACENFSPQVSIMPSHILVVEDDVNSRDFLSFLLRAEGYQVSTAEDGQEGFDLAKTQHPDLIISDLHMAQALEDRKRAAR